MVNIETLARDARERAGVVGLPGSEGLNRIVAAFADRVKVHYRPWKRMAFCYLAEDGYAQIVVPPNDPERLSHELAHVLIEHQAGLYLGTSCGRLPCVQGEEEGLVDRCGRAIIFPPEEMWRPDAEIQTATRCRLFTVRLRRLDLKRHPPPDRLSPLEEWEVGVRRILWFYGIRVSCEPPEDATAAEVRDLLGAAEAEIRGG